MACTSARRLNGVSCVAGPIVKLTEPAVHAPVDTAAVRHCVVATFRRVAATCPCRRRRKLATFGRGLAVTRSGAGAAFGWRVAAIRGGAAVVADNNTPEQGSAAPASGAAPASERHPALWQCRLLAPHAQSHAAAAKQRRPEEARATLVSWCRIGHGTVSCEVKLEPRCAGYCFIQAIADSSGCKLEPKP